MVDLKRFTEANRGAWNAAMPYHRKARDSFWNDRLADPDFIFVQEPELGALLKIGIKDQDIAHLCCNNGLELISLKRLGARRCVGFDICDEAIRDAVMRSERFGNPVEFHRTDVYDLSEEFNASFDLVYITIGALAWLPDLSGFFRVARKLLRQRGILFLYDSHPFTAMLPDQQPAADEQICLAHSYFPSGYLKHNDSLDYYDHAAYEAPDTYEFLHTLSEIFGAILANAFRITGFQEFDHDISNLFPWAQKSGLSLPLCYILVAQAG